MSLNQQFEGGAGGSYVKLNTEDDADKAPIVVPAVVVEPTVIFFSQTPHRTCIQ